MCCCCMAAAAAAVGDDIMVTYVQGKCCLSDPSVQNTETQSAMAWQRISSIGFSRLAT